MEGPKGVYRYDCFITDMTSFGLFDDSGDLRCTSPDIDGVLVEKKRLGWGTIRRIRKTKDGIIFGRRVNK